MTNVKSLDPKERAKAAAKKLKDSFQPKAKIHRAIMGDGVGNLAVSGQTYFFFARVLGKQELITQVYCRAFIPAHGQHVNLAEAYRDGRLIYVVVDQPDSQGWFDTERGYGQGSAAPAHHTAHEMGGPDMLNVGAYMLENLRATPTDPNAMKVYVSYGYASFGSEVVYYAGGESGVFTAPTFGERWDLLSIDAEGNLIITQGTEAWSNAVKPACPEAELPIAYILLRSTDTYIESNRIYDARPSFAIGATAPSPEIPADVGGHLHIFQEDKSLECDGVKIVFILANQCRQYALNVFHNGHLLREGIDKDYTEDWPCDQFTWRGATPPNPYDTLLAEYILELQ